MTFHIPRHQLEELAVDREAALGDAHLHGCAQCAARLRALVEARAAFLERREPADFARAALARQRSRSTRVRWVAALAVAAAVSLLWLRAPDEIRLKGGRNLQVFVQRNGQPEAVEDGQPLAAGDQLAFAYSLTEARHLLLLSIDEAGAITRYYPTDATGERLGATSRAQLPVGVELDAHRGEERLFALFSREPLDEARARDALRAALREAQARGDGIAGMGHVALPVEQASLWFRKP